MATSVLLACGLNEKHLQSFTFISEDSGVDSSFLISSILGQRNRISDSGTILVCLHQSFAHYSNASIRLGTNLQVSLENNLQVIDTVNDIADNFLNSEWLMTKNFIQLLWNKVQVLGEELLAKKTTITIIIDDLSAFQCFGVNCREIVRFCGCLKQWSDDKNGKIAIVAKLNTSECFEMMTNQILEFADTHVAIERLKSGNFKEVDGNIVVKRVKFTESFDIEKKEKKVLFKVLERNIKIFISGEVGIKV